MAFSIYHDRITSDILSASRHILPVDESPQPHKSLHRDAWLPLDHDRLTATLVKHPAGDHQSQIFLTLDNDGRVFTSP